MTLATAEADAEYAEAVRLLELSPREATAPKRFVLMTIAEVERIPPPTFLVEDIIPDASACEIHGPPGGGKTFLTMDLALCVASGASFFGHKVRRGPVVYVIGEGQSGLGARIRAWKAARQMFGEVAFYVVPMPVQLLQPADVELFVSAIIDTLDGPPVLIVLDTFARCFLGGEENSARDMGMAVATVDALRRRTGAAILLVHHTRKAGDEERGSIALRGGMDTMLSLKGEGGRATLSCEKQKDAPEFGDIKLHLVGSGDSMVFAIPGTHTGPSRAALGVLETLIRDFPTGSPSMSEWKEAADTPKTSFWRLRAELLRAQYVSETETGRTKRYAATPEGRAALAFLAKDDNRAAEAEADRFHRFQIGSKLSGAELNGGVPAPAPYGCGPFRDRPEAGERIAAASDPTKTSAQVPKVPIGTTPFLESEKELAAYIEERRSIQLEAHDDDEGNE